MAVKQTSNKKIHEKINRKGGRRTRARREMTNSDIRRKQRKALAMSRRKLGAAHGTRLNYEITKPMYKPVRKLLTRIN